MIGFNALGRMGRLGNQMFQYAALKGLARNIGADITIPYYQDAVDDGIGNMLRTELFDSFDLEVNIGLLNNGHAPVVQEKHFHFDEELFRFVFLSRFFLPQTFLPQTCRLFSFF